MVPWIESVSCPLFEIDHKLLKFQPVLLLQGVDFYRNLYFTIYLVNDHYARLKISLSNFEKVLR